MKAKGNKKRKQKSRAHKKCIIVTSEQMQAVKESIKESGQAVFLGATITAVSLFSGGCVSLPFCDGAGVRQALDASSPQELAELLKECSDERYYSLRAAVAKNPNTPENILAKLAGDKVGDDSRWVRGSVAINPSTPVNLLEKLAKDEKDSVREGVASNPKTPPNVLAKLAEDKDWRVRSSVAGNPNTPANVLAKLTEDKDNYVRGCTISNPNTPPSLRDKVKKYCSLNCTAGCIGCTADCTGGCTGCTGGCTGCTGVCHGGCTRVTYLPW